MFFAGHRSLDVVVPQVSGKLFGGRRAVLVVHLVFTGSLNPSKLVDCPYKGLHSLTYLLPSYELGNVNIDHRVALAHDPFHIIRERIGLLLC